MNKLFFYIIFFQSFTLFSQTSYGLRIGIYNPLWDADKENSAFISKYLTKRTSMEMSLIAEKQINKRLLIQPEFGVIEKETLSKFETTFGIQGEKLRTFSTELALMLKANYEKGISKFNFIAGPFTSYTFSGKTIRNYFYPNKPNVSISYQNIGDIIDADFENRYKRLSVGYQVGASFSLRVEKFQIFFDGRYSKTLNNISTISGENIKPRGIMIQSGFLFSK